MAIRISHLDHCTILVTNVQKSRHFYGEVLGLREIPPPREFDFQAIWYRVGNGFLHLLVKSEPDTHSPRHFCLHVENIEAAGAEMIARGIAMSDTVKIAAANRFFISDPDGNRIELLEWERAYQPETDGLYQV